MLDRLVNIFFSFFLVVLFFSVAKADDHLRILLALVLASFLAWSAFILNWLTYDGATAASIFGTIAFGLGGLTGALIVVAFFFTGSVASKDLISGDGFLEKRYRRNGIQVWANGFWFALWIIVWFLSKVDAFLIAAIVSVASATADTWATELGGNRMKGKTWLITSGDVVEPGTDGGISISGTLFSLLGAFLIASIFSLQSELGTVTGALIVGIAGFLGSLADSVLGATLQHRQFSLGGLPSETLSLSIDNNWVNWLACGSASVLALIITFSIGL
ncbi:MAG: DUF92 domain-containing protein [Bacteroidota bacterium]